MINQETINLPQSSLKIQENISLNSTLSPNNDIMRIDDTHSLVKLTEYEVSLIKSHRINRSLDMTEYIPRKETEKEISRLDKDILEIKSDVKNIKQDLQKIESKMNSLVTKEYLNKEFKPALLNEFKVHLNDEAKKTRKWLIGLAVPSIISIISIIIAVIKIIFFKS